MIDYSDAVGFPLPAAVAAYYDQPRRRRTCNWQYMCQHGEWAGAECLRCDVLKGEADLAYLAAIAASEVE